jgi:hypothetical protein
MREYVNLKIITYFQVCIFLLFLEYTRKKNTYIFEIQFWVKFVINKMLYQAWRFRIFCSQDLAKFRNDALGVEAGRRNASYRKKSQRSKIFIRYPQASM